MKSKKSYNTKSMTVLVAGGIVVVLVIGAIIAGMNLLNDEPQALYYVRPATDVPQELLEDSCADLLPAQIAIGDTVEIEESSHGMISIRSMYSEFANGRRSDRVLAEEFTNGDTGLVLDGPECLYIFTNNQGMRVWLLEKPNGAVGWVHEYDLQGPTRNQLIPVSD